MQSITPQDLKDRIDSGNVPVLIDVREPWEYETCRIDGSQNIPMSEINAALEKMDKDTERVIICHYGMRSQQVAGYLASLGYKKIFNLEGGIDEWARTVAPDMPQY